MRNKFTKLFREDMTDKQICFQYWEVLDREDLEEEDKKALREAYEEAVAAAADREAKRIAEIEKENTKNGMTCIVCA